jgi:hypothetical protein
MDKRYKKVGRKYVEVEPSRFGDIDFFEFSFLVEACCGRRPIARSMFFQRVIDKYYHVLTQDERDRLFEWINRSSSFQYDLEKGEESCLLFNARFDRNNQFLVSTFFGGKEDKTEAFKYNGRYYTKINTSIVDEYITKVERLNENN